MVAHLKLVSFNPNPELSPATNLKQFIAYCRDELTLWADTPEFSWDAIAWPDSYSDSRIRFTNMANTKLHPSARPSPDQLLHPAMQDVLKAYLRYRHTLKPHRNAAREAQAFRAIEQALAEDMSTPDITKLQERHFKRATQLLVDRSARQNIVLALLQILTLLSEKLIVPAEVVRWLNPYVGSKSYDNLKGGKAPAAVKLGKVADQDAFFSIADVFTPSCATTISPRMKNAWLSFCPGGCTATG